LRHFLRASFDQHERALGLLEEELTIVRMYLDIEMLRFGSRLKVEQSTLPQSASCSTESPCMRLFKHL
jgi:LytS/YehU family sensor histidine kinase